MLDLEVSPRLKVQWIEESHEKYKAYPRAKELLNRRKTLEAPAMSFLLGSSVNSDMGYTARVEHRNVSGVELSWYLMPEGEPEWERVETKYRRDRLSYVKRYGRLQKTERLTWKAYAPYESVTDTFDLSVPGVGYYMIVAKADGQKTLQASQIQGVKSSRLLLVGGFLPDSTSLCTVVEGCTGRPVPSATVEWYYRDTLLHTALTDAEGKARWRDAGYIRNHMVHYSLMIRGTTVMRSLGKSVSECLFARTVRHTTGYVYIPTVPSTVPGKRCMRVACVSMRDLPRNGLCQSVRWYWYCRTRIGRP